MKNVIRTLATSLALVVASISFGAVPAINVKVADASGKLAYKGATDGKGVFATPKLPQGNYAVQFTSNSAPKGSHYTFVVSAGSKKVAANAIAAEKLAGGGVAMKIAVGAGLNITGQVAAEDKTSAPLGHNGKPMVWIAKRLGSNIAAHWAESDSAEAKEAMTQSSYSTKNLQDRQSQGSSPGQ
ncbi:MAG: hypothetical protein QOH01_2845 [Verrucomicrobiota bacterium]|jgi:hypothetical protein